MKTSELDWTKADPDGTIHIPDELDSLFNKIGMQLKFHTISGLNEVQTITNILWAADQFYKKKYEKLVEPIIPEGWTSPKRNLPENGIRVFVLTNKGKETIARFERLLGNDIWETDYESEEDEKVIGWKKIEQGQQIDLFSV